MIISIDLADSKADDAIVVQKFELEVETLENPAVQKWVTRFCQPDQTPVTKAETHIRDWHHRHPWDPGFVTHKLNMCKLYVEDLAKYNYKFETPWPTKGDEVTQNFLNVLHRFFTHTQQSIDNGEPSGKNIDYSIYITERRKYLSGTLCHTINDAVHEMENYIKPTRKFSDPGWSLRELMIDTAVAGDNSWLKFTDEDRKYHSDQHYDVILSDQILGKSILGSYLNNDDPNDWDTTGHYTANGSLHLQINDFRQRIYRSRDFNDWYTRYGLAKPVYDFPIGNINNKNKLIELYGFMCAYPNLVARASYRI